MKKLSTLLFFLLVLLDTQAQVTLVLNPGPEDGKDANIRTDQPDSNYGNSMDFIANAFTAQSFFFVQRSFMAIDLSSIPQGAQIQHADISLYCNTISGHAQYQYGENECVLQRVTQDWQEYGITWDNQPQTTAENQVHLSISTHQVEDYPNIDITELVKDMLQNPSESYGLMIRLIIEDRYRTMVFGSYDHPDPLKRPVITIVYDSCTADPVNVAFSYSAGDSLTIAFHDMSNGVTEWNWDFGDGTYSDQQNPIHTYLSHDNYLVCLTARNMCFSGTYCDSVELCSTPIALFHHSNLNDSLVSFTNASQNTTGWLWEFGDGIVSTEENPVHAYPFSGSYQVCLTAFNPCGYSVYCEDVDVCKKVLSHFSFEVIDDSIVKFTNLSQHATTWLWDFGDGTYSTEFEPEHAFEVPAAYSVCLRSMNSCSVESECNRVELLGPPQQTPLTEPLIIFPNPSRSGFTIMLPDSINSGFVRVMDMNGHLAHERVIGNDISEIQIPKLEIGIYVVEVQIDGRKFKYKILAQ
ncbi:MAG: DNRLRE domain-containing protein [Bacteroidales bacterium]|nr:DNRLRE domain-containing protein [Bacteroidales bacterium]